MHHKPNNPAQLADADPARWPIQIRQTHYGWTVTCYNSDGHARHILTADSEMEAYRAAYNMAKIYHIETPVLVNSFKGELRIDLNRLLKSRRGS
ncbi:MAG: hypothetical protein ACQETD_07595 [Pseudomonadota bacterium]